MSSLETLPDGGRRYMETAIVTSLRVSRPNPLKMKTATFSVIVLQCSSQAWKHV